MLAIAGTGLLASPSRTALTGAIPATPQATPAAVLVLGETPGAIPVSLLVENTGTDDDRLLDGSTSIAARVEMHQTRLVDGRQEMRVLPDGIVIPAGSTVVLEPGASHLMLGGLRRDLVQGETFPLTVRFARAGEVTIQVRVRRKVDWAGVAPFPLAVAGELRVSLAGAPPAPALSPLPNVCPHPPAPSPSALGDGGESPSPSALGEGLG